jgi:hypothetical protein
MEASGVQPSRARTVRARAAHQADEGKKPADGGSHPRSHRSASGVADDGLETAWGEWVLSFEPRLVGHVPPQFPWFARGYHVRAFRLLQDLVEADCGERPTIFGAIQSNGPNHPGEHSHPLLCGSEQLLSARRSWVWERFRAEVGGWPGFGQPGVWAMGDPVWTRNGFGRWSVSPGEREWRGEVVNGCRFRLEPVRCDGPGSDPRSITYYVVRYCLREDRETGIEILGGSVATRGTTGAPLLRASEVGAST